MSTALIRSLFLLIFVVSVISCLEDKEQNATDLQRKTFKEAEKEITDFITAKLRSLLPKMMGGAGAATIGQKCQASMMKIFGSVRRLKGWTLKIMDSMGKPTAGILKGTSFSLGHYDQCVDLAVDSKSQETQNFSEAIFQGMYCKVKIRLDDAVIETAKSYHKRQLNDTDLGKLKEILQATLYLPVTSDFMNHYISLCLPSSCTTEDVQQLIGLISFPGMATVERCEIKTEKDLNSTQGIVSIIFLVLVSLVCISTFIHWLFKDCIESKLSENGDKRCVSVAVSFSICNNTKRLMKNIEDDVDSVLSGHCVRGVVVASIAWIIVGHTYMLPNDTFYLGASSLENLRDYLKEGYFSVVVSFPLAVDALFVCYGFILTYSLWHSACKADDVEVSVIKLIVCNYLRFVIPVLIILGVASFLSAFGSGPFWHDFVDETLDNCNRSFPAYVGMYSNFLGDGEQCFPHLWYTSCLAQLTLAGILLSWVLSRNLKFGIILTVLLILAGNIAVGIITYYNELPPAFLPYFSEDASNLFFKVNYSLPLSHFGPYALGMLAGIFVNRRLSHSLRPYLTVFGWVLCICLLQGLLFFIFKYHMEPMGVFWSALYAGSHRTIFGLCVVWVIVACSFGNGGFVNAILSWRLFDPLFRLSYYAYIFHFVIIFFTAAVAREHFHYSHCEMILKSISYIAVTYILSYISLMLLESPLESFACAICPARSSQINLTARNTEFNSCKSELSSLNGSVIGSCKLWSISNNKTTLY